MCLIKLFFVALEKSVGRKLTIMFKQVMTFELMTNFSYTFYKVLGVVCQITRQIGFHTGKLHPNVLRVCVVAENYN